MNIYKVIKGLTLTAGMLLLSNKQAAPRARVLIQQPLRIKSLELHAEAVACMGVADANAELAVYELTGTTQFKVGEIIGLAGDVNKTLLEFIAVPTAQPAPVKTDAKIEVDTALFAVINKLEPENKNHWTAQGKPELAALSALAGRKITGKERDAAFAAYQAAIENVVLNSAPAAPAIADDLRAVLIALDLDADENFDAETGMPKLELISSFCQREISADELSAALDVLEAEQETGAK